MTMNGGTVTTQGGLYVAYNDGGNVNNRSEGSLALHGGAQSGRVVQRLLKIRKPAGHQVGRVQFQRLGQPGDLKGVVVFLASGESDYMTGQAVNLDGGRVMGN